MKTHLHLQKTSTTPGTRVVDHYWRVPATVAFINQVDGKYQVRFANYLYMGVESPLFDTFEQAKAWMEETYLASDQSRTPHLFGQ